MVEFEENWTRDIENRKYEASLNITRIIITLSYNILEQRQH